MKLSLRGKGKRRAGESNRLLRSENTFLHRQVDGARAAVRDVADKLRAARQQLAVAQADVEKKQREIRELKAQVADLTEQLERGDKTAPASVPESASETTQNIPRDQLPQAV